MLSRYHWSIHQLTEWFVALSQEEDEELVIALAVERAAEALDAEIGAVEAGGALHGALGFDERTLPSPQVLVGDGPLELPGLGALQRLVVGLGRDCEGRLVVARAAEPFAAEERQMLLGMGRVLGLRLQGLRTLVAEQQRERLLETLLSVQRAVSRRAPLQDVLDSITRGASNLLLDAPVALVLARAHEHADRVASTSWPRDEVDAHPEILEVARRVIRTGRPADSAEAGRAHAAPVHAGGKICGALAAAGGPDQPGPPAPSRRSARSATTH